MQTDPLDALDRRQLPAQPREAAFAVEVSAVARQLLGNDLKFLDALCHQALHFRHNVLDAAALLLACNNGDGAIGTVAVAALAYFEVGIMGGCGDPTFTGGFLVIGSSEVGDYLLPVELPIKLVHLGQFRLQFLEVALRKATHHDELPQFALLLPLGKPENHVDAFLLRVADETASVHDGNVPRRLLGIVRHAEAVKLQLADELLAVNEVLAATEGNKVDSFQFISCLFGRICNPPVVSIGICNPATLVLSHFKCLYSMLADCKSARANQFLNSESTNSLLLNGCKSSARSPKPM